MRSFPPRPQGIPVPFLRIIPALALLLILALPPTLHGQLPLLRLWSVFPPGGTAGSTVEVTLTGADLEDLQELRFSSPDLTATPKTNHTTGKPEPSRFVVTIASNAPPGLFDVQAIGRFGISNPRTFAVDLLPELTAAPTNRSAANATTIAPGSIVNAHTAASAADFYRFTAPRGTRLLISCLARELDSRLDPVLLLHDADGRELRRSRTGDALDFTAPADGPYTLKIHDRVFRGGDDYFYRLTLQNRPHIEFVLPKASNRISLHGQLLPGGTPVPGDIVAGTPLDLLEVDAPFSTATALSVLPRATHPAAGAIDATRLPAPIPGLPALALPGPAARSLPEHEPNNAPNQAQTVTLPADLTGRFHPANDVDLFRFDARKGEVWWIDVASHRLGRPTDPAGFIQRVTRNDQGAETVTTVLELADADANVGGPEFNTASRDPVTRFEVKEDGTYQLLLRDLFGRITSDPRNLYHLSIRKEAPAFQLVLLPQAPPPANRDAKIAEAWTTLVRRGETLPVRVIALRRDGFNGPIDLTCEGLPAGLTASPARIDSGANATTLFLTAADNAARAAAALRVVGKARIGDQEIARAALAGTVVWTTGDYNNEPVFSRYAAEPVLAVSEVEAAPVSVLPDTHAWTVPAGGKLRIPWRVTRRDGFGETLKLKATGLAPLDGLKELEVDAKTNAAALEIDLTQVKLEPGSYSFHLQTQTKGQYRNNPEAAKQADDALKQIEEEAKAAAAAAKQAGDELEAARKAGKTDLAPLETTARTAADKSRDLDARKAAAAEAAKQANEKAKAREVLYTLYSQPVQLVVQPQEKK